MKYSQAIGAGVVLVSVLEAGSAQELASPATYRDGPLPEVPFDSMAVGGGEVIVELIVRGNGSVASVRPLRVTASFVEPLVEAVRSWRFDPAQEFVDPADRRPGEPDRRPVESRVMVASVFRPPTFNAPTLGEPIRDVAAASAETPFPISTTMPPFPPLAYSPGAVLIELRIDSDGAVVGGRVMRSAPPFDSAALDASLLWKFRPARVRGIPSTSLVYIIFGFPRPVV